MSGPTREQILDAMEITVASAPGRIARRHDIVDAIQALYAPLVADRDVALAALERAGYRRCDIPACNCGRWHAGADSLKEENERLRADLALAWPIARAANFEALRAQHDLSFADPPSYHDDCGGGVLVCEKCIDTILGQIWQALHALTPDQRARLLEERA